MGSKKKKGLKVNKSAKGDGGASNGALGGATALVLVAFSSSLSSWRPYLIRRYSLKHILLWTFLR